eukprot:403332802
MEDKKDQLSQLKEWEKQNYYSQFSIFGKDVRTQFKQHQLRTNFHAKLLHSLDSSIKFSENLDALYTPIIKQQVKYLRHGRQIDEFTLQQQKDESTQKIQAEQQIYSNKILSFDLKYLPPQEGGVDYKNQFEKIQVANLALLDEIKRIDMENKFIKSKFEAPLESRQAVKPQMEMKPEYFKTSFHQNPPFQLQTHYPIPQNPFFTSREPFVTHRAPHDQVQQQQQQQQQQQNNQFDQRALTKQHLRQFDTLNPQQNVASSRQLSNKESLTISQQVKQSINNQVNKPLSSMGSSEYDQQFSGNIAYDKRKRFRRTANEIERRFVCWCGKSYGSEGSLNQHKKLKSHYDNNQAQSPTGEQAQSQPPETPTNNQPIDDAQ